MGRKERPKSNLADRPNAAAGLAARWRQERAALHDQERHDGGRRMKEDGTQQLAASVLRQLLLLAAYTIEATEANSCSRDHESTSWSRNEEKCAVSPPLSGEGLLLHHVIQWWKIDFIQNSILKYACDRTKDTVFQESLPFEL